jgi:hypothetical protein
MKGFLHKTRAFPLLFHTLIIIGQLEYFEAYKETPTKQTMVKDQTDDDV